MHAAVMALTKLAASQMSKCISYGVMEHGNTWICRAFVTPTRPREKQYVDKETCEKVKDAAQAITEAVKETRQTGEFVKETIKADAGKVISEMAKKVMEKATEDPDEGNTKEKSAWEKVKEVVNGKGKGK